ncbi:MAG: hypothetical protein HY819_14980 [Acidobacteria bacterium]|nr:hypothetical protein [Acidobacteriota bacterium]
MALFEVWIERSDDMKYIACFENIAPEKGKHRFVSDPVESSYAAVNLLRQEVRKVISANDQIRIKNRIKVYDNYSLNDALEELTRN